MAGYGIELTESAKADLNYFSVYERRIIVSDIRTQLSYQPLIETRNRKPMRDNAVAPWVLRTRKYRTFYEVLAEEKKVRVVAIGHKEHNELFVRGRKFEL